MEGNVEPKSIPGAKKNQTPEPRGNMTVGVHWRSENCAVPEPKGTPSDQTACPGLMNVDLGALMMANLQRSRDAHLCVSNSESRSTDKARHLGADPPNQNKKRITEHRYKNSLVRVSV